MGKTPIPIVLPRPGKEDFYLARARCAYFVDAARLEQLIGHVLAGGYLTVDHRMVGKEGSGVAYRPFSFI